MSWKFTGNWVQQGKRDSHQFLKMKNRDIIITGLQPWDIEIGSNCKNIALEFAKHNRVLYVNAPLDRMTALRQKNSPQVRKRLEMRRNKSENLLEIAPNLWNFYPETLLESVNSLPSGWIFNFFNRMNNKRLAKEIKKAAAKLNFKDFILFTDSDMFRSYYLKELLSPAMTVYYTRDNLLAVDFWKRHGEKCEPALMAKSDLVFANSTYLAMLAGKHNHESYYVGQGCDLSMYEKSMITHVPEDIAGIARPVIGYTGALYALRLDPDTLLHIARQKPEWSLVLIGPEDEHFRSSELHQLPNVHFLGNKKPEELPAFVNSFDVAINPQKLNEVTRGNYPRKIDEYLALGKPVVATNTEAMSVFSAFTYLAENKEEYIACIEKALREDSAEKAEARELFARGHSWENSVSAMYEQMNRLIKKK